MRRFVDERARNFDDTRHAGHTADEHEFVNLRRFNACVFQARFHRPDGALEQFVCELFHLRAGQSFLDMLRPGRIRRDERQVDVVSLRAGECDFGFFGFFLDALECVRLLAEIHVILAFEFIENPIHERVVPVVAAEMRVAVRGLHFKHAVADFEHGNIKRAAAQIVDGDLLVFLFVEAVSERGRRRFVNDAQNFETGDLARVLRGLTLRVVEISGNGDDSLRDLFAKARFSVGFQFGKNHRGNFLRRKLLRLAVHFDFNRGVAVRAFHNFVRHALNFFADLVKLAAHETLHGINRVARVRDGLALRGVADHALAGFRERHDGRRRALALGIFEHERLAAVHDRHAGVRRA